MLGLQYFYHSCRIRISYNGSKCYCIGHLYSQDKPFFIRLYFATFIIRVMKRDYREVRCHSVTDIRSCLKTRNSAVNFLMVKFDLLFLVQHSWRLHVEGHQPTPPCHYRGNCRWITRSGRSYQRKIRF